MLQDKDLKTQDQILKKLRRKILTAAYKSSDGHIPSSFSILEILYAIFIEFPKSSKKIFQKDFDFILSKGHAALAIYAIFDELSIIDDSWIETFSKFDSKFGGHPDYRKLPEVGASTGSLGHGLPIAVGKALANKVMGNSQLIFCIIGDGELNEGSIWESLILGVQHELDRLVVIIDLNHSSDRAIKFKNLYKVFKNFGFNVSEINGHSIEEITQSFLNLSSEQPNLILANTIKGFGLAELENNPAWHHLSPNEENFKKLLEQLL